MSSKYYITDSKKDISFSLPKTIRHKETRRIILGIVKELNERGELSIGDLPQLHRMATAYDCYLQCVDAISEHGMTMKNLKGEVVKRPEANLLKESWTQYLDIAKEYGFTPRSKKMTRGVVEIKEVTAADDFFGGK